MEFKQLESFVALVQSRSFTKAAERLYISQPTISTHIKQLENELGVQLLVRSTKDVLLSEEGKVFYPYALQLLETESRALKQLNKCENESGGMISMAVSSVPGNYMFPQFLAHFRMKNATTYFRVLEGDSGDVLQKLLNFDAEIGIGGLDSGSDKIHSEVLFEDEIVLITPNTAKYRELNGKFPLEQLRKEWFITRELGSGTKNTVDYIEQELKLNAPSLKVIAQFETSEMVRRAVEEGAGVAFISKTAAKESFDTQKVLEFSFPNVDAKRKFYLMYHKERGVSPLVENVIQGLRDFCAEKYNKG